MNIDLYLTPMPLNRANLENKTVAIIDVLRFCTSTCAALMVGAKGVIPTIGPGEAVEMWTKLGGDVAVLAGERDGLKIENFPLGNSPAEFTEDSVGGRFIVMTTTNGTGVFRKTYNADLVVCCALVNISRVAADLAETDRNLVVVCSGREGGFSIEDTICGGMLIHLLTVKHKRKVTLNDAGSLALLLYQTNRTAIKQSIQQGEHGQFLAGLGFAGDVEIAAGVDTMPVLPVLKEGRLVPQGKPSGN
jgi:2-phosphosulfolactate phosphatase